jgi:hypothetical protein
MGAEVLGELGEDDPTLSRLTGLCFDCGAGAPGALVAGEVVELRGALVAETAVTGEVVAGEPVPAATGAPVAGELVPAATGALVAETAGALVAGEVVELRGALVAETAGALVGGEVVELKGALVAETAGAPVGEVVELIGALVDKGTVTGGVVVGDMVGLEVGGGRMVIATGPAITLRESAESVTTS